LKDLAELKVSLHNLSTLLRFVLIEFMVMECEYLPGPIWKQIHGITIGTNCALLVTNLFMVFCELTYACTLPKLCNSSLFWASGILMICSLFSDHLYNLRLYQLSWKTSTLPLDLNQ
jgi:hypothetical protein